MEVVRGGALVVYILEITTPYRSQSGGRRIFLLLQGNDVLTCFRLK
jgi:hypothetical protein